MKSARLFSCIFLLGLLFCSCDGKSGFESGYIPVSDDGLIYYEAEGEGTPVILLHGHTLDLRMWDPQMDSLKAHYRVIRPEMRGYGHSSKQFEGHHHTHLDDMIEVMDALHIDKAHVVGLSMGSFVASEMVAMHPERLLSATLASGGIRHMPGPSTPFDSTELAKLNASIEANLAMGLDAWKERWINQLVEGGGSRRESIRESVTAQVNDWDGWQLFHNEGRLYYGFEATDTLKARCPEVPVLILSGENEHKGHSSALRYLPNGREAFIKDCGHMSNMEQPEEFTRLVLELLRSCENPLMTDSKVCRHG